MSKVFSLLMIIPIWFIAMLYLATITFYRVESQSIEDWRIKTVVNYCTDSAIEELLEASDLGMDYADWGKFHADPDLALKDFVDTFLLSYRLPLNNENREMIKTNYIQAFCVAGYDGYYVYDHRNAENGGYTLVGSPKIPYLYADTTKPGRYVTYALNMGNQRCYKLTDATITQAPSPVSDSECMKIINTRISDDLMERVDRAYTNGWLQSVYIPTSMTALTRTNPVQSPTVMAFMDNIDLDTMYKVQAFGIGGSRAKVARPVSAYIREDANGNMVEYYSYTDLLPDGINNDQAFIKEVFMSPEDAAEAGYHHDTLYMN